MDEHESLWTNIRQLHEGLRDLQNRFDTLNSPAWKRMLFRIDGWGPWYQVRRAPHWRPWRRWFKS